MTNWVRNWVLILILMSSNAYAGLMIEDSFFYDISSVTSSGTDTHSRIFDSFFAGSTFAHSFFIGWNMSYATRSAALGGNTSILNGYEMGPKIGMFLNKGQTLLLAVALNPLVRSTSTLVSGAVQSWSGMGAQGEIAYSPQIGKHTFIGVKLIFDYVSYTQSTDSSNLTSSVSYSSPVLMPTIYWSLRFD